MAENYHNIWAKKKKSDLGSRGDLIIEKLHNIPTIFAPVQTCGRYKKIISFRVSL